MVKTKPLAERFWAKVKRTPKCWLWSAGVSSSQFPYGIIGAGGENGRTLRAHRVSWELTHGPIPPGMFVCHKCDNPRCVRPSHLFLGSNQDNVTDMVSKKRSAIGDRHAMARFTNQQVEQIRKLYAAGNKQETIAQQFGTTQRNVSRIVLGYFYKEAGGPVAPKKSPIVLRGSSNGNARLTESQVSEIRSSNEPAKVLASRFGVCRSTIRSVILGNVYASQAV